MSLAGPGAGQHTTTATNVNNGAISIISNYPSLAASMDLNSDASFIQWELKIHLSRFMDLVRRSRDTTDSNVDHINDISPLRRLLDQKGPSNGNNASHLSLIDHGIRFIMVDHRIVVGFIDNKDIVDSTPPTNGATSEDRITLVFRDLMGKHVSLATVRMATSEFLEQHLSAEMSNQSTTNDPDRERQQREAQRPPPPTPPAPSRVARVEAVNEQYIPAFDKMFNEGTESARAAELVHQLMRDQSKLEERHPLPLSTKITE
jgi:hypothetical protein